MIQYAAGQVTKLGHSDTVGAAFIVWLWWSTAMSEDRVINNLLDHNVVNNCLATSHNST